MNSKPPTTTRSTIMPTATCKLIIIHNLLIDATMQPIEMEGAKGQINPTTSNYRDETRQLALSVALALDSLIESKCNRESNQRRASPCLLERQLTRVRRDQPPALHTTVGAAIKRVVESGCCTLELMALVLTTT